MGTHYSIDLYFPINKLECALEEINKLSEPVTDKRMSIALPDGKKIVVAHTLYSTPDKRLRKFSEENTFIGYDTVFSLSADAVIQEALVRIYDDPVILNKDYPVGSFRIILRVGQKFSRMTIGAVASSQNKILLYSPSMHSQMNKILNHCDGLFGLIDTETGNDQHIEMILLADTERQIYMDRLNSYDSNNIDYLVDNVLRQLRE